MKYFRQQHDYINDLGKLGDLGDDCIVRVGCSEIDSSGETLLASLLIISVIFLV